MKGDLAMNNFLIKNSGDPIDHKDVANTFYVNSFVNVIKKSVDKTIKDVNKLMSSFKDSLSAEIRLEIAGNKFTIDKDIKKLKDMFKQHVENIPSLYLLERLKA